MATKRSKNKSELSPAARKPKQTAKKPARQPPSPRSDAAAEASQPAAAKAAPTPALLALTTAGLDALRAAIDSSPRRSGAHGATRAKRDKSLSDALDRLDADYARLLR